MTALRRWLLALLLTAVAVAVCYLWIDRPLALLVHAHSAQRETFARLTYLPDLLIPLAAAAFVAFGLWALAGRPLSKIVMVGALCSISLIVAETIKSQLKFACGRLWPETWVANNPSFIHDGAYGFNLFHGGGRLCVVPIRAHGGDLRRDLSALDHGSQMAAALCAGRAGSRRRADRRQLSLPQRRDRRRLRRHLDRLDDGRALAGAPIARHSPASGGGRRKSARAASAGKPNTANTSGRPCPETFGTKRCSPGCRSAPFLRT